MIVGGLYQINLKVFNRWGELTYETKNPKFCWNGTQNGNNIEITTTFFYWLIAETECNIISKKGDVIILR
jgi:large repetitive protein